MHRSKYSAVETKTNEEETEPAVDTKQPSLPRGETVTNSIEDDRKAQCWTYIKYVIVFIICVTYFIYQLVLFADADTNQQISASIDPIETVEIPFFYIEATDPISAISIGPNNGFCDIGFLDMNASIPTSEPCETQMLSYVYNKDATKWTIIQNGTAILIYPPYEKTMRVNQWLSLTFRTKDPYNGWISDYNQYIQRTDDNPYLYRLHWFADNTHFIKDTHAMELQESNEGIINNWVRKAEQTVIASVQSYEIGVLNIDSFGDVQTKYSVDSIFHGPTQSTSFTYYNQTTGVWYHQTRLVMMVNALETQTTITFSKKLTFLDCVSKTGGIFGLVFPASGVILAYLLSGFAVCKYKVPGIAPNAGLSDEEKRKVLTYMKEIKMV